MVSSMTGLEIYWILVAALVVRLQELRELQVVVQVVVQVLEHLEPRE
jgi:hypothetical protein